MNMQGVLCGPLKPIKNNKMNYISTIVKQNKQAVKKSAKKTKSKKKTITVAIQKVETTYVKVIANSSEQAMKIARSWNEEGKNNNKILKMEILIGPHTYGYAANSCGIPFDKIVNFSEE